jgi:hypothetical protein
VSGDGARTPWCAPRLGCGAGGREGGQVGGSASVGNSERATLDIYSQPRGVLMSGFDGEG